MSIGNSKDDARAVAKVETDAVTLSLSKDEVGALPSVRVHR